MEAVSGRPCPSVHGEPIAPQDLDDRHEGLAGKLGLRLPRCSRPGCRPRIGRPPPGTVPGQVPRARPCPGRGAWASLTFIVAPLSVVHAPGKGVMPRMKSATFLGDFRQSTRPSCRNSLGASRSSPRINWSCGTPWRGEWPGHRRCRRATRLLLPSAVHRRNPPCRPASRAWNVAAAGCRYRCRG